MLRLRDRPCRFIVINAERENPTMTLSQVSQPHGPLPHGPLQGVKVVACSTAQAGTVPYMLMADLGAEVIKIEPPDGGDNGRTMSILPGHPSSFFETNNRGVKSVTLNLKTPEGRKILKQLVATADIFGQNFRPGAAEKNGFGYEELKAVNPKLVYISISGYGAKGPHADLPGTDSMAQALGGIAQAYAEGDIKEMDLPVVGDFFSVGREDLRRIVDARLAGDRFGKSAPDEPEGVLPSPAG